MAGPVQPLHPAGSDLQQAEAHGRVVGLFGRHGLSRQAQGGTEARQLGQLELPLAVGQQVGHQAVVVAVEVEGADSVLHDQHLSRVVRQGLRLEVGVLKERVKSPADHRTRHEFRFGARVEEAQRLGNRLR